MKFLTMNFLDPHVRQGSPSYIQILLQFLAFIYRCLRSNGKKFKDENYTLV
jgi:hypothetical protein